MVVYWHDIDVADAGHHGNVMTLAYVCKQDVCLLFVMCDIVVVDVRH